MKKIDWCKRQKNGIELIKPNMNLREGYLKKAESALKASKTVESTDWKMTTSYYCIYYSIYSIMMQAGVKCEIHSCTLEFAREFLKEYFTEKDFELFDLAFEARKDHQYYVGKEANPDTRKLILDKTPEVLVKCKGIYLKKEEISRIREVLEND